MSRVSSPQTRHFQERREQRRRHTVTGRQPQTDSVRSRGEGAAGGVAICMLSGVIDSTTDLRSQRDDLRVLGYPEKERGRLRRISVSP